MPPQEFAFAAPRTEEMTRVGIGVVGAGITGLVEGVAVKMAPQLGAAAPIITWGTLIGAPLVGASVALFSRGMIADLGIGVAAGGIGVLGYSLPEMIAPALGRRAQLTQEQLAALAAGGGIKQLPSGAAYAAQRAQAGVKSALEF